MSDTNDPEVPEADALEQKRSVVGDDDADASRPSESMEAPEADALEQAMTVGDEDDEDEERRTS